MARRKEIEAEDAHSDIGKGPPCKQSACDHARPLAAIAKGAPGDNAGRYLLCANEI